MACSSCYNNPSPCPACDCTPVPLPCPEPIPIDCPDPEPCDVALDSQCVIYTGGDLPCIGLTAGDPPAIHLNDVLDAIEAAFCQAGLGVVFTADTNCIELDGDGTQADPLTAAPRVHPGVSNLLQCTSAGLSAFLNVDDSDCVSLSGVGTVADPLVADVIIDPRPTNLLSCGVDGLLVTGSTISIADSNCIDLSGNGSAGSPLTASPIISTTAGNILTCTANGLLSKLNVNTVAGCVALSGDGTSGSPLAVSLTTNSTLQCTSGTLGVNPNFVTANNGLTKTGANIQLGGPLIQNTLVDLATFKLTLKDNGAAPTGIEIIPGAASDTNWTTANVNRISGKNYINGLTWVDSYLSVGPYAPVDAPNSVAPETTRLRVVKILTSGLPTSVSTSSSTFNLTLSGITSLGNGNAYSGSSSTLYFRPSANITVSGAQDKFVTGSLHQLVFEPNGALGDVISNGKVAALTARGYFNFARSIDSFSAIRIANSVPDASGYTGTVSELIGLKIDDQKTDPNLTITKSYAIKQLGVNDENRYQGPTYHVNNVGIGTAPAYGLNSSGWNDTYPQGARLQISSSSYTLPTTGQSSLLTSSTSMTLSTPSTGPYSVGRVVSNMNALNIAFTSNQNLDSGSSWAASFSYLRFTSPRTITGTTAMLASNAAQCNFVSGTATPTNCTGSTTNITCNSTSGLLQGMTIVNVNGAGAFTGTVTITAITGPTTFTVSAAPTTPLSGATITAQLAGDISGTVIAYRAMTPIADVAFGFDGTVTNAIGVLVEQQSLIQGTYGAGVITNTYGIVQGSISDATKGQNDKNIINATTTIFKNLPVYANEAAAVTGGLVTGTIYQTATGEIRIKL